MKNWLRKIRFAAGVPFLVGAVLLAAFPLLEAQNTKEFIYFGNRTIAIENGSGGELARLGSDLPSGAQFFVNSSLVVRAIGPGGVPVEVTWYEVTGAGQFAVTPSGPSSSQSIRGISSGIATIRARFGSTELTPLEVNVVNPSVAVEVVPVSGQPNQYEANPDGTAQNGIDNTKWMWSISPAGLGSLSAVNSPNLRRQAYTPPALNYCDQDVVLSAQALNSSSAALGAGGRNVSLARSPLANLPSAMAGFPSTVSSGASLNLVASLPQNNCSKGESWTWSGTNVQQVGSQWRFNAPAGIGSNTNYSVTATEGKSGKVTIFTITVVPATAMTVTVSPNPISLAPYARVRLTASTGAINPSFSWGHTGSGTLLATSGASVCFDAGPTATGTAQVTATMTSGQGGASGNAAIQFSTTGFGQTLPPGLIVSPMNQAVNLNQGLVFTAVQNDGCDAIQATELTWVKESGPGTISSGGVYSPPSGGGVAEGTLLVARAIRTGTTVFGTRTYVHAPNGGAVVISEVEPIPAGSSPVQLTVSRSDNQSASQLNWEYTPLGYGIYVNNQNKLVPPPSLDVPRDFTISATSSAFTPVLTGSRVVRITTSCTPTISVTTNKAILGPGESAGLSASNSCPGTWSYEWSIDGITPVGTVSSGNAPSVSYVAPASISVGSDVYVRATLRDGTGRSTGFAQTVKLQLQPLITVPVSPATATAYKGQTVSFSSVPQNVPSGQSNSVTWTVEPGGVGSIHSNSGVYTAPLTIPSAQTLTIRGTSVADTSRSGTAVLNLIPVSVEISGPVTLGPGATQTYTASVAGTPNTTVSWSKSGSSDASVHPTTGVVTVASNLTAQSTITLTATTQDEGKIDTHVVTLTPAPGVYNIQPNPATVYYSQGQTFTAQTYGLGSTPITWSVSASDGISAGYIHPDTGAYQANVPAMAGARTIKVSASAAGYWRHMDFTVRPGLEPVSVSPTGAGPAQQTFSTVVQAHAGVSQLQRVWFIVGNPATATNQCKMFFDRGTGNLSLQNDAGSGNIPVAAAAGSTAENSQCRLHRNGSGETLSGNTVTTTFNVQFLNYGGSKGLHVYPIGYNGHGTGGWVSLGSYTPPNAVTISISPNTQQTLQAGQTKQFMASVSTGGVNWSLSSAKGTISAPSGSPITYTAPSSIPTPDSVTLTATSTADPTKTASVVIQLSNVPPPPTLISLTPLNGSGANPTFVAVFGGMPSGTNANIRFAVASGPNDLFNVGSCTLDFSGQSQSPSYVELNPHPGFVQWSYTAGGSPTYYMYNSFCNLSGSSITKSLSGSQLTLSIPLWFSTSYPEYKRVYINYGGTLIDMGSWTTQ